MEDNLRPFTPMIDRDPPTPEPIESTRKGQKGGTRTPATAALTPDASNAQDSPTNAPTTRGKDKPSKETGKSTGKDGQSGSRAKGARSSVKSNAPTDSVAEEKETDNEQTLANDGTIQMELSQLDSDSNLHAPATPMADVGYIPFMVEPDTGSIAVGASQIFKVKFAPLDINDYQARLVCW